MTEADQRLLDVLYRGATDATEFERALNLISECFACKSVALIALDRLSPGASLISANGVLDAAASARYVADFAHLDPAAATFARMPVGTASTTDRVFTEEQHRNNRVFLHEFYYPLGLAETIGGLLQSNKGRFELIGLHRGADRPAFRDSELATVERLIPHLTRTLQLRRAFLNMESRLHGLQNALDRLEAGIVQLDAHGNALFVNGAYRAIAGREDGLALDRRGYPVPSNMDARNRLNALIDAVRQGSAGGVMAVPRPTAARSYALLVAPVPSSLLDAPGVTGGALILVHDPENSVTHASEILQQGLGLSDGAARLVAALAAEDDLKSFAEREKITIHTARFHLRTALARTGARTQAELVRIAVRLLRDFALRQQVDV